MPVDEDDDRPAFLSQPYNIVAIDGARTWRSNQHETHRFDYSNRNGPDADRLHDELGARFELVSHREEIHDLPFGTRRQFVYCYCKVVAT